MRAPRIRYYLNLRATVVLTAISIVAASGLYFLWGYQEDRVLQIALKQVKAFQKAGAKEKDLDLRVRTNDLALRHLNRYLEFRPNDPEGLEIKAELLTVGGDSLSAANVYEHLLRVESAGPRAQAARRRLATIYLLFSEQYRSSMMAKVMPEDTGKHLKFYNAELRIDQLLAENAKAKPPVDDAEAHRLRAAALEGQIIPNKDSRKVDVVVAGRRESGKTLEEAAILEYRNALTLDPGDVGAARRLADIYQRTKNPAEAQRVLDGLLKARPDAVDVRLARYGFFRVSGDARAATNELEAASALAPEDLAIILTAADDALQSDSLNTAEARRWINKIPERFRDTPEVLTVQGMIEYAEHNHEEALRIWRTGLERANASNPGLTRQLATLLLELGRDTEAAPLVEQYRRLVGDNDPVLRYLVALQDEHASRFSPAIEGLEWARDRLPEGYEEPIHLALGRCHEKQGEWDAAEESYRAALQFKPKSAALRHALARLLVVSRPEEAVKELEQGLVSNPNNPTLLLTLAEARLQQQKARRPERRNWADFETVFKQAATAAPQSPALALYHAEQLAADAKFDQAIAFLKEAVEKIPNSAALAIRLAEYLQNQGHSDQALQVLANASDPKAAGDRGSLRIQQAQLMAALGQGREARILLVRNVDRLPVADRDEVWRFLVLLCRGQADQETTRAAYNEWARLLPNDSRPKLALLEMELETGDPEVIRARLDSLRPRDRQGESMWRLAQARARLSERSRIKTSGGGSSKQSEKMREALLKEADVLVESVLHEIKIDPAALLLRGQILEAEGAGDKAVDSYVQAKDRGSAEALLRLIDLLVRLGRKSDLERLRHSDTTEQLDQIVAVAFLIHGDKEEASRIIQQSLREKPGRQVWQVGLLDSLGENEKAESALRTMAEQSNRLQDWLSLVRFQTNHGQPQAATETIAEIKRRLKVEWPELLEAECRWAAADWPAADKAFDEARKRYPEVYDVQIVASRYFEDRGRLDMAEACLRRILARNPNDRSATRQLALVLATQAHRPGAWKHALELLGPESTKTNTPEERLARAIVLGKSGDRTQMQQAIDLLQGLVADTLAENPVAATAHDMLARLLLANGQADQASKVAALAATRGSNPSAIALYAEALLQSKHFDAVELQRKRLESIDPGSVYVANLGARLIVGRSKPGEAAAALEKAYLERENKNSPGAEMFGREAFSLILAMDPKDSVIAERLGLRLAEHNTALSWMPALILASQGKYARALTLCRAAVEVGRSPMDLREASRIALEVAVASRTESAAVKQADEIIDVALQRNPEGDDLLVMKAMTSHLVGRFDEEIRLYRIVLTHLPHDPVVLNNIAWALSEGLNQPSEALEKIDELLKDAGRNGEALDTRGVILMRLGRLEEAVNDLEEAVKVDPSGPRHFHLAQAYKKLGWDDKSRKSLEDARRAGLTSATIDPNERAAFEALTRL